MGPIQARDAYVKPAFLTWRAYAERSGQPWFILSTKYGLIRPEQLIEDYDVSVARARRPRSFLELLERQGKQFNLGQFERVVLLDWKKFELFVRTAVPAHVPCVLRTVLRK